jgi:hypothetical protein
MTTIGRAPVQAERARPEPRQEETTFVCTNPDHHLLASRRERIRLRDRRFSAPAGMIPAHDYCGAEETREAMYFAGRPGFLPPRLRRRRPRLARIRVEPFVTSRRGRSAVVDIRARC